MQSNISLNEDKNIASDLDTPIFILGLPRSGSTLWHNIITSDPRVFRIGGMLFLTPWRKDFRYFLRNHVGDLSIEKNNQEMINLIFSHNTIPGLTAPFFRREIKNVNHPHLKKLLYRRILHSDKSLGSIFKILIEEITTYRDHKRCCVKFPVYVNQLPKLFQWYPNSKIIHITRDPRAIALSKTNDISGTRKKIEKYPHLSFFIKKITIFFVIIQYIWTSKLHWKYKNNHNYALFRYEDLLSEPEKVIKKLCKFTGIDFVPEMLEPQKGKEKGQSSSLTGKPQKGFDKNAAHRWVNRMSTFDKTLVTLLTKRSMKRFGYDPKNHPVFFSSSENFDLTSPQKLP